MSNIYRESNNTRFYSHCVLSGGRGEHRIQTETCEP